MPTKKGISAFALCAFVCNTCLIFFALLALFIFLPFDHTTGSDPMTTRVIFVLIILVLTISNLYVTGSIAGKKRHSKKRKK